MATSRSRGRMSLTTSPPISIVPSSMSSSPAMVRSSVLLPQPEGPTSTVNSPSAIDEIDAAHGVHAAVALVQAR